MHDREITISAAGNRTASYWGTQKLNWSEFAEKLRTPIRSTETLATYLKLPKPKQDNLKDCGGYIGGELADNIRKASNVKYRDLITLDLDSIPAGDTQDVLERVEALECAFAVYSTRKHHEDNPRLRVVVPLNRSVTSDEYEPIARKLAFNIGIDYADPTTFQASRLMYWPSASSDSEYVFEYGDKNFLDADELLATYNDWRNIQEWPVVPGQAKIHERLAAKQGNPLEKDGIIGAFCRQYDIHEAIETFLPGVYEDAGSGRYTFEGGSTVGGAIIYDDVFLYSHHATDPVSGLLVNAFDLVRIHKFGEEDLLAKPGTPVNKIPSFKQMLNLVSQDPKVRKQQIEDDFGEIPRFQEISTEFLEKLEPKPQGKGYAATAANVKLILNNDPALKDKFARDVFAYNDYLVGSVPWRDIKKPQAIDSDDDAGLRNFLSEEYGIAGKSVIEDALAETFLSNEYHPVRDYLSDLDWDGVPRVETLLIDYLGAEDNLLTRTMTKLTLTGAVARVMNPGCKFDYVLLLIGAQGIGKSSFLSLLGGQWYTDSLEDVRGKDAYEQIQGSWILELGELAALRKADVEAVKRFVSAQSDKFRQAYAKRSKEFPRQCIFIATTNVDDPLKDQSGNRRFWPVQVGVNPINLSDRNNFPRDQVWAEAVHLFKKGTPLMLPAELEVQANIRQGEYTEESSYAGLIREKLNEPWGLDELDQTLKDRVCALEIWEEILHFPREKFTTAKGREINAVLKSTPGWKMYPYNKGRIKHGKYGKQTVFERVLTEDIAEDEHWEG